MKETRHPYLVIFGTIICGFLFVYLSRFLTVFPFFGGPDARKILIAILLITAATAFCSTRIFSLSKETITFAHIFLALLGVPCIIGVYNLEAAAMFFGRFSPLYDDYEGAGFLLLFIMWTILGLSIGFSIGRTFARSSRNE